MTIITTGKENVLDALKGLKIKASEKGSTIVIQVSPADCIGILAALKEKFGSDNCHLSSVAGNDLNGDGRFEVNYLLLVKNVSVIVKTETEKDVESVTKIFPGAILFERELYEMFGINVVNHPDLRNFFLPKELTKAGTYPLRKSLTNEQIRDELRRITEQ